MKGPVKNNLSLKAVRYLNATRCHINLRITLNRCSPVGYHSKLSERPYIYTFDSELSTANIVFVVKYIMEYNDPLIKKKHEKEK